MDESKGSGKKNLIQGTLRFIWEEIKTLNRSKVKGLTQAGRGYLQTKRRSERPPRS